MFLAAATTPLLHAQSASCGISSITETAQPAYPPIARAAHVSGKVILLVNFGRDGRPLNIRVLSGPPLLQHEAIEFVKTWQANDFTGPRECPVVISFELTDKYSCGVPPEARCFRREDTQHFVVLGTPLVISDPGGTLTTTKQKRFIFF